MAGLDAKMEKLKVGAFERRLSIAKASLVAGSRFAASSAGSIFASKTERQQIRKDAMRQQAEYLVKEIGKLKGSVVKIGQMMALYGEHFLPPEVTEALHTLNDSSAALSWNVIEAQIKLQLGDKINDLTIDKDPIGAASLAQVHRATVNSTGQQVVLKIQYPGVADAIDADLSLFKNLLKLTHLLPQTKEFEEWFEEVRQMMHREVDYRLEVETTKRFAHYLKDDTRFVVPQILDHYCTHLLICMTFEKGIPINDSRVLALSQERRNALGDAAFEIILREIFEWGEMQTDPNFGNYLVSLAEKNGECDKVVLLDFGAIRQFDGHLLGVARGLLTAGYYQQLSLMTDAMQGYEFFTKMPIGVKKDIAEVFLTATEPLATPKNYGDAFTSDGHYVWAKSNLHTRVMQKAAASMASVYFSVPPKEFMFISRKFIGAYTFMTVINAITDTHEMAGRFVHVNTTN